ncbi:hypothetical protein BGZ76_010050 [Entomortierella beljakovae]|nr:hypothetical protein BGZ76_010050 [Entomortierella beljakovae]
MPLPNHPRNKRNDIRHPHQERQNRFGRSDVNDRHGQPIRRDRFVRHNNNVEDANQVPQHPGRYDLFNGDRIANRGQWKNLGNHDHKRIHRKSGESIEEGSDIDHLGGSPPRRPSFGEYSDDQEEYQQELPQTPYGQQKRRRGVTSIDVDNEEAASENSKSSLSSEYRSRSHYSSQERSKSPQRILNHDEDGADKEESGREDFNQDDFHGDVSERDDIDRDVSDGERIDSDKSNSPPREPSESPKPSRIRSVNSRLGRIKEIKEDDGSKESANMTEAVMDTQDFAEGAYDNTTEALESLHVRNSPRYIAPRKNRQFIGQKRPQTFFNNDAANSKRPRFNPARPNTNMQPRRGGLRQYNQQNRWPHNNMVAPEINDTRESNPVGDVINFVGVSRDARNQMAKRMDLRGDQLAYHLHERVDRFLGRSNNK